MLNITKKTEGRSLYLKLDGRLDSLTSGDLEKELMSNLDDLTSVTLDFKGLEYVSSAGLRVLLNLQQTMEDRGQVKLLNVNDEIMSVFELTGYNEIMTIE